ncbi:MAG: RagB/SusD family nutrient uptake outer membrane protein [Flavobacteriaceae bacterium]
MKNNHYFLFLILFLLVGCNDDFLDRYSETEINDGTFWNSEEDLKIYNNQLYAQYFTTNKAYGGGFSGGYVTMDNYSDNAFLESPDDVRLGLNTVNTPGRSNWDWGLIRDINQGLENGANTNIDDAIKNIYLGEARLLRALDYYDKLKLYGKLPIIDRVLSENDELLYASQSSRNDVLAFIKADLDFAVLWLPESASLGRFNKQIAQAYKARIMLHEGTFRKYHNLGEYETFLNEAESAAQAVISSDKYSIDANANYIDLFSSVSLKGNNEVLFYKEYGANVQIYSNIINLITFNSGVTFSGTKSLVSDYLCTDGLSIDESPLYQGDDNITNEFANRDLRLSNTFAQPNTYFVGDYLYLNSTPATISGTSSPSGYQIAKFYNESQANAAWGQDIIDAPLVRYAEVLLIYAEAKAELGTITQTDINNSINLLRAKAGVADLTLNASTVLDDVRRERRVELAFEGFRYDDIVRWKQGPLLTEPVLGLKFNTTDIADAGQFTVGEDIYLDANGYILSNRTYLFDESKNYYFPIPIEELSLNPNLDQTDGWQ